MTQQSRPNATHIRFGEALRTRRQVLGWNLTDLAGVVRYDKSQLSRLETGKRRPTEQQAKALDEALRAGGSLIALAQLAVTYSPAQLPVGTARFYGRDRELAALHEAFEESSTSGAVVVAIDGPPGSGKTALALRFAHHIAARFPGGQLYADLRGHSPRDPANPADVLEEFLSSLGVAGEAIPTAIEQRAALLRSTLANAHALIVLDNAADSDQLTHLLPGIGTCTVVITSRERLSGLIMRTGATCVTLGPMDEADSVQLLNGIISASRGQSGRDDRDMLAQLAERCGRLPLALRIAAERVVIQPHNTVGDLIEELDEDDSRLDALDISGSLPIRKILSWSYGRLDADTARVFRLLGLHRGPYISAAATAALTGLRTSAARRQLDRLAGAHLIHAPRRDAWSFHDLLADYAAELAAEDDLQQTRAAGARLTSWYLHSVANANWVIAPFRINLLDLADPPAGVQPATFADEAEAVAWCEAELPNIQPIVRLALEHGDRETAWKLPVALWNYLLLTKPWGVWIASHKLALTASGGDDYAHGWVATNLAEVYRRTGQLDLSDRYYRQARELRERAGDRHGLAWSLAGSACLASDLARPREARDLATAATELFAKHEDHHGRAMVLGVLGDVHHQLGDNQAALASYGQAHDLMVKLGSLEGTAHLRIRAARVHEDLGNHERALADLLDAVAASRKVGDAVTEVAALTSRAELLDTLGEHDQALQAWAQALTVVEARDEAEDEDADRIRVRLAAGAAKNPL